MENFDNFIKIPADNELMNVKGFTIQEIADELGVSYKTAHKRLETAGIKPLVKEAIYPASAIEAIRDVKMGRPPKTKKNKK